MRLATPKCASGGWPTRPVKSLFRQERREPSNGDGIITAFRDGEVTLRSKRRVEGFTNAILEIGYQGVRRGDLVIHGMDGFAGAIGVSDADGKASPVVHCYVPTGEAEPRFYAYFFRDLAMRGFVSSLAKGIRERSTAFDVETFRSLVVPYPPPLVQRAIADYLDAETARIDGLIEKKRRIVHLLEERFQSSLHQMTTMGRPMALRRLIHSVTSGPRGWADRVGQGKFPFVRSANLRRASIYIRTENLEFVDPPVIAEAVRSSIHLEDVLIGITGANTGWVGLADPSVVGGFVSQHVALIRPLSGIGKWLAYSLASPLSQSQLLGGQYGGTKQQLGLDDLRGLTVHLPDRQIRDSLMGDFQRLEDARQAALRTIELQVGKLLEHRQALITAAVTGELPFARVAA